MKKAHLLNEKLHHHFQGGKKFMSIYYVLIFIFTNFYPMQNFISNLCSSKKKEDKTQKINVKQKKELKENLLKFYEKNKKVIKKMKKSREKLEEHRNNVLTSFETTKKRRKSVFTPSSLNSNKTL